MRHTTLLFFFNLITAGLMCQVQQVPSGVSEEVGKALSDATNYMNQSKYDSAQYVITATLMQNDQAITKLELYYLRCYEAEIMYYNALFEQGLNMALWSLELAKELKDDLLTGSSHNFVGLFLMNLERSQEAVPHFVSASQLIPQEVHQDFLSQHYHATGNLGECYLKLNMPDSAIHYSLLSGEEAALRNIERGSSLAQANIAEAYLRKMELDKSIAIARKGYESINKSVHRDVVQVFCNVLMQAYTQKQLHDSVNHWMNIGLRENDNPLNTDLSRVTFIQHCIDTNIELGEVHTALDLLKQLNAMQQALHNKQQAQRIAVLKGYYEQNNQLALTQQLTTTQKKELQLRTAILAALAVAALLLTVLIIITRKSAKQRQHIAELQHQEELQKAAQTQALQSLQERMEALFAERNRIASDLHDDIGAALSSIRIYSGAAQKHFSSNPQESEQLIQRINQSSTGMMDRMSDIVWSINPKNDNGESLVLRMKTFASEVLSSLDIHVQYRIQPSVEELRLNSIARRNLYLIFKEAITNISKYSKATEVVVELDVQNQLLMLRIEDNGQGFYVTEKYAGNGLNNMNARTKALDGKFHLSSHRGKGTFIHMEFPLTNISDTYYHK
jgi:signal transduction histidine kinase